MPNQPTEPKRLVVYAATYIDRGERLTGGRGAIKTQLEACRRQLEAAGDTIAFVGVDVIVERNCSDRRLEQLVIRAEELAHQAFADSTDELTFYVAGLRAQSRTHDPRDDGIGARATAIAALGHDEEVAA